MSWSLEIENIAGIRHGSAELHEGTNAVRASNWRGKSSFLTAVGTAMGYERALTESEQEGHVILSADGNTFEASLERQNGSVSRSGTPFLDDEYDRTCAALFASLDGDNEVRRAVRLGDNLEEVLTKPLDLEDIDRRIGTLRSERDSVDSELERAREHANRLPSLQQQATGLENELEDLREREQDLSGTDQESTEDREELSDLRAERERVRNLIERLENSVDRTEKKLEDAYQELETLEIPDDPQLDSEIAEEEAALEARDHERELVQSMYSVTERFLEEDKLSLLAEVDHGMMGDDFECWVCGSEVTREAAQRRLDAMGENVVELREEVETRRERIGDLKERRDEVREARKRKQDLESEVATLESNLAEREESLQSAMDRLDVLEDEVETLQEEVGAVDEELTDVRSEIKYKEAEFEDIREEIEECEREAERVDQLEERRGDLADEIATLQNRKDRLRSQLREEFDATIDDVVERFDTSFEGARLTSTFDLVVARDGREVSRDALSEGELELLGIVTALAGFETYDVADFAPVILLDEVGALADANLDRLVEYIDERARFLVVTAYPENSQFEDHEISPDEWEVVRPASARTDD